ncbi:Gram-negative bacterial tonB protein [Candidatus Methylomirabilis lanthanidiphila]|uniref:Gram-negative bacterial tonB protein n=1 Tax=Candidatus Methylomirabilis lanthanidiphila TaxID=2211376 RepID=A0A564ZJA4_9BACT|nr:TonB C-terminal domain-containing protein [Candidatus Methylomirabilis lanthanidiphila]VUZ85186.1 Gram-negative bacterial tonB protein [Candidatus Methylomirabilis lanthanidiphila]
MAVGAAGLRLPVSAVSSSCGLSLLLHGLLVAGIVYGPQWLHGKPFTVPLNYEVTLISPKETVNAQKSEASLTAGRRSAAPIAKAPSPPRDVLTLPSSQRSGIRNDELALPSRRRASERQPGAPAAMPQAPPRIVAPLVSSMPSVSQPVITAPGADLTQAGGGQGFSATAETGVTVGNTDPALAYYFVLIQDKITSNWTPPKMSPGTTASVSVSLKILRSGQVRGLTVGSPSGDRLLDDSAVRAVSLSSPLPPLPPLYKAETLSLDLRFTFVGEKS